MRPVTPPMLLFLYYPLHSETERKGKTMLKISKAIVVLTVGFLLSGCNDSAIDRVKNGTLSFDPSTTVGKAFDGYQFFENGRWETFEDSQSRVFVRYVADYSLKKEMSLPDSQRDMSRMFQGELGNIAVKKIYEDMNDKNSIMNNISLSIVFKLDKDNFSVERSYYTIPQEVFDKAIPREMLDKLSADTNIPSKEIYIDANNVLQMIYKNRNIQIFSKLYFFELDQKMIPEYRKREKK